MAYSYCTVLAFPILTLRIIEKSKHGDSEMLAYVFILDVFRVEAVLVHTVLPSFRWPILTFLVWWTRFRPSILHTSDVWIGVVLNCQEGKALLSLFIFYFFAPSHTFNVAIIVFYSYRWTGGVHFKLFGVDWNTGTPPYSRLSVVKSEHPADCFECCSIIPVQTKPFPLT